MNKNDPEPVTIPSAVTTATTVATTTTIASALTNGERHCMTTFLHYAPETNLTEARMLQLRETGEEGILPWAGGYWISYDKIMEACQTLPAPRSDTSRITTTTNRVTPTTQTTIPPNPGDAVSCSDFDAWQEAQDWYDIYAPHYGDIALIDTNNNGIACEKLIPAGVTAEELTTRRTTPTNERTVPTTRQRQTTPTTASSRTAPQEEDKLLFLLAVAEYATGPLLDHHPDVPLHFGEVACLNLDDGQHLDDIYQELTDFFGPEDGAVVLLAAVNLLCPHHDPTLDRWLNENF